MYERFPLCLKSLMLVEKSSAFDCILSLAAPQGLGEKNTKRKMRRERRKLMKKRLNSADSQDNFMSELPFSLTSPTTWKDLGCAYIPAVVSVFVFFTLNFSKLYLLIALMKGMPQGCHGNLNLLSDNDICRSPTRWKHLLDDCCIKFQQRDQDRIISYSFTCSPVPTSESNQKKRKRKRDGGGRVDSEEDAEKKKKKKESQRPNYFVSVPVTNTQVMYFHTFGDVVYPVLTRCTVNASLK